MPSISCLEIDQGVERSLQAVRNGRYLPHSEILAEKIGGGAENLMEVLAVQVVADTTLDVLRQSPVKPPAEINKRAIFAAHCALQVVLAGAQCDLFLKPYEAGPLDTLLTSSDVSFLTNPRYLIGLSTPVYFDSGKLVGGAFRKLYGMNLLTLETRAETIKRSTGLLAVNKIARECSDGAWDALGNPYVEDEFLTIHDVEQPEVKFSPAAREIIINHTAPGSGCPAAILRSPNSQGTLLSVAWEELVDYYLQPDAAI